MATRARKLRPVVKPKPAGKRRPGAHRNPPRPAPGHLDSGHAARLRRLSQETDVTDADVGFVRDSQSRDELTERLGEEAVSSMTSGESKLADDLDEPAEEERGGPFVETRAGDEFADGVDASNTADATREPFPKTSSARWNPAPERLDTEILRIIGTGFWNRRWR